MVYVVTRQSLARPVEIFNYLTNMSPRRGLRFNPLLVYGEGLEHLKISPAEFAEFLGTIFPVWWRHRADFGHVEPFASLVQNLAGEGGSLTCTESGACASSHLNVLPDGSASHCGRSADWGLLDYGSIQDRSFSQIFSDPRREVLRRRVAVLPETECKGCRVWDSSTAAVPWMPGSPGGLFCTRAAGAWPRRN